MRVIALNVVFVVGTAAAQGGDLAFVEKGICSRNNAIKRATRIISQVQNVPLHATSRVLSLQFADSFSKRFYSFVMKSCELDVADVFDVSRIDRGCPYTIP